MIQYMLSYQEKALGGLFLKGRRDLKVSEVFIATSTCANWNRGGKMSNGENSSYKSMEVERQVSGTVYFGGRLKLRAKHSICGNLGILLFGGTYIMKINKD